MNWLNKTTDTAELVLHIFLLCNFQFFCNCRTRISRNESTGSTETEIPTGRRHPATTKIARNIEAKETKVNRCWTTSKNFSVVVTQWRHPTALTNRCEPRYLYVLFCIFSVVTSSRLCYCDNLCSYAVSGWTVITIELWGPRTDVEEILWLDYTFAVFMYWYSFKICFLWWQMLPI